MPITKPPIPKATLEHLYYVKGLTWKQIGTKFGMSYAGIQYRMNKLGIKAKPQRGARGYKRREDFFQRWSPEMAWVLGLMFADGNVTRAGTTSWYCTLSSNNAGLLQQVKKVVQTDAPVRGHSNHSISMGGGKIGEDLIALGCTPRKSRIMRFPQVPPEHLPHFVRGLWDGDGTIFNTHQQHRWYYIMARYYCGSKDFIESLHGVVQQVVEHSVKICEVKRQYKPYYMISYAHKSTIRLTRWMYQDSTPLTRLDRKYQIAASYLDPDRSRIYA